MELTTKEAYKIHIKPREEKQIYIENHIRNLFGFRMQETILNCPEQSKRVLNKFREGYFAWKRKFNCIE